MGVFEPAMSPTVRFTDHCPTVPDLVFKFYHVTEDLVQAATNTAE